MIERGDVEYRIGRSGYWEAVPLGRVMAAKNVRIAWDFTEDYSKVAVVVVTDDEEEWAEPQNRRMLMSGGACYRHWMAPVKRRDTPACGIPDQCYDLLGTFGTLLATGFATKGVLRSALIQFARVDNCVWARRMLFALDGELSEKDLAHDEPVRFLAAAYGHRQTKSDA